MSTTQVASYPGEDLHEGRKASHKEDECARQFKTVIPIILNTEENEKQDDTKDQEGIPQRIPKTLKPSIFYRNYTMQIDNNHEVKGPKNVPSSPNLPEMARFAKTPELAETAEVIVPAPKQDEETKDVKESKPEPRKGPAHLQFLSKVKDTIGGSTDNMMKGAKISKISHLGDHPYRQLVFNPKIEQAIFKRHLAMVYKGIIYSASCLKGPTEKFIKSKQVDIQVTPSRVRPKTLALDLDETMSHTCSMKENPDLVLVAIDERGNEISVPLKIRPYLKEFLQEMSQHFEIVVYTAGAEFYAKAIIHYLDPNRDMISHILSRTSCMETKNGFVIKDLRIIRNRDLKDIVIVDNLAHSFGLQIENGIPILEYVGDPNDMELKFLAEYLIPMSKVDDVREYNKERLRLRELKDADEVALFDFS